MGELPSPTCRPLSLFNTKPASIQPPSCRPVSLVKFSPNKVLPSTPLADDGSSAVAVCGSEPAMMPAIRQDKVFRPFNLVFIYYPLLLKMIPLGIPTPVNDSMELLRLPIDIRLLDGRHDLVVKPFLAKRLDGRRKQLVGLAATPALGQDDFHVERLVQRPKKKKKKNKKKKTNQNKCSENEAVYSACVHPLQAI